MGENSLTLPTEALETRLPGWAVSKTLQVRTSSAIKDDLRSMDQHLTRLEQETRQPPLTMGGDEPADTKTRERTEGAAKAVQAEHRDSCTAQRVQKGPKTSTCFGVMAEHPDLPCRDDVVVKNGAAAPKSCLPPLERRSPTAAEGLLPIGEASIATMTTYNQPPLRLYSTEETDSKKTNLWTPILVLYDSSFLPAALS